MATKKGGNGDGTGREDHLDSIFLGPLFVYFGYSAERIERERRTERREVKVFFCMQRPRMNCRFEQTISQELGNYIVSILIWTSPDY